MSHLQLIRNSSGFTIVELMVALMIMAVGMFGVLETLNVSLQHNMGNELRNEAIKVGERYMNELRGTPFDDLTDSYATVGWTSEIRGASKTYSVERSSEVLAEDSLGQTTSRQLNVRVKWGFRNVSSQNTVISVVARP